MTKGLPGSGKTTWAKEQVLNGKGLVKRVNKDDLRNMIDAGKHSRMREEIILAVRDTLVDFFLLDRFDVIVDDTNLEPKHEAKLRNLADMHKAEFIIKDFTDVPLEECLFRDAGRVQGMVGQKVIRDMYNRYLKPEFIERPRVEGLPDAIIVDIDGTVATHPHRSHYDYSQVIGDLPRHEIINIVRNYHEQGVKVLIVSGRDDSCQFDTYKWLQKHAVTFYELHMRKTGDTRTDHIVKQEIYDNFIKDKFNVRIVLDDRNQVVDMWRRNGLVTLQVAEGNF